VANGVHFFGELFLFSFLARMVISMFLDKDGRQALARRAHLQGLEDELKVEMAKTNALISALNNQGKQQLGISDARRAEIDTALASQMKAQEALEELDPETRRLMIERALNDQEANNPAPAGVDNGHENQVVAQERKVAD